MAIPADCEVKEQRYFLRVCLDLPFTQQQPLTVVHTTAGDKSTVLSGIVLREHFCCSTNHADRAVLESGPGDNEKITVIKTACPDGFPERRALLKDSVDHGPVFFVQVQISQLSRKQWG